VEEKKKVTATIECFYFDHVLEAIGFPNIQSTIAGRNLVGNMRNATNCSILFAATISNSLLLPVYSLPADGVIQIF
jgi:hypothetical protein